MKLNTFYGYNDCNPKDSSVEEIFQIIRQDARVKYRTEKHRYYLEHNLEKEALVEKSSNPCFSVATLFANGKTQKHKENLTPAAVCANISPYKWLK